MTITADSPLIGKPSGTLAQALDESPYRPAAYPEHGGKLSLRHHSVEALDLCPLALGENREVNLRMLGAGHDLKMIEVDAEFVFAAMMQDTAIRDRPVLLLPQNTMDRAESAISPSAAVSITRPTTQPNMASRFRVNAEGFQRLQFVVGRYVSSERGRRSAATALANPRRVRVATSARLRVVPACVFSRHAIAETDLASTTARAKRGIMRLHLRLLSWVPNPWALTRRRGFVVKAIIP